MRNSYRQQKNEGFTLIEVLVAVAIIVILASGVLFAVDGARAHGRDAQRNTHISQLEVALRLYFDTHGEYPNSGSLASYPACTHDTSFNTNGCMRVLLEEGLIPDFPKPIGNYTYHYDNWCRTGSQIGSNGSNVRQYRLWVYGELDNDGLAENWWDEEVIGSTTCVDPS